MFVTDVGFNGDFFEMSLDMFTFEDGDKVFLILYDYENTVNNQIQYISRTDSKFMIIDNLKHSHFYIFYICI